MDKLISKEVADIIKSKASPEIQKHLGKKYATKFIRVNDYCNQEGTLVKFVAKGHHDPHEFRANCWDQYHLKVGSVTHEYRKETFVKTEDRPGKKGESGYIGATFSTTEPCDAFARRAEPITVGKP